MAGCDHILEGLNSEQRQAASTIEGPVLVLAGAGTGKTRVITVRIAYMLVRGIAPENILGMTFTNKAAREMRERLEALCGEAARKVTLGTFHSFCVRVLRRDIRLLGYLPGFSIADDGDQSGLVKQAIGQLGFTKDEFSVSTVLGYIGRWKNQRLLPEDVDSSGFSTFEAAVLAVYGVYQQLLQLQNTVDFDDLLLLTWRLFDTQPEVLAAYRDRYRYLLVDEYQDTNQVQFEIVRQLAGERANLCVVGDDDQSIYGWRGADIGNILDFPEHFPGGCRVHLEQNYRSTNAILKAANAVISGGGNKRFDKNLWSALGDGEPIRLVRTMNGESEAEFVANYIRQCMDEDAGRRYSDFAVLYRSNNLSRQFEETFRQSMIPYTLVGGQEFYKRREIKDAVSYLKLLINPRDDQSLLRILGTPPRGLADKAVEALKRLQAGSSQPMSRLLEHEEFLHAVSGAAAQAARELAGCLRRWRREFEDEPGNLAIRIERFLGEVGYLDGLQKIYKDREDAVKRRENVGEFLNAIAIFERKSAQPPTLGDYLESFALLEENDRTDESAGRGESVTLSTVHASKGLEFPHVFLVAMEEGIFPHERAKEEGSVDEELRLFYVAITRAKSELVITRAQSRMNRGRTHIARPSNFLYLLPEELYVDGEDSDFIRSLSQDELANGLRAILDLLK